MKIKKLLFILLPWFMIMGCQQNLTATYYISPSGNDSHSGTSVQTAWRTIDKVNAVDLDPGDKVLFQAGRDYHGNLLLTAEDAGTPKQPVVIGSYGSGRARIKAGDGSGVTVRNAGGVVVENLIVIGNDYRTNAGSGIKIVNELPNNQELQYIRVHNVEASGFGREPYQDPETEGSSNGYGIIVSDSYIDVRITNCTTYENEYCGIFVVASNFYVGYCKMYDNPGDPNYFENHSGSGILVAGQDAMIEYCEAYNNGYQGGCKVGGPIGIWAAWCDNVVIQYCESHHNRAGKGDGGGFHFDGHTTNSVMQYNYSHDNDGAGYLICSYEGAGNSNNNTVRYNISANDARKQRHAAIHLWTGSPKDAPIHNTQIYGNTIYASTSPAISIRRKGIYNTKVCNNLFITANNQKLVEADPNRTTATFAGNAYWAVDGKYDFAGNSYWEVDGIHAIPGYKSLEDWRAATGQETLNGKPVGLLVDPKLMDLGKSITVGDPTKLHTLTAYRLQKDSPLIDAGLDLKSLFGIDPGNRDFYGNPIPQGKAYDIGAHEIILENTSSVEQK